MPLALILRAHNNGKSKRNPLTAGTKIPTTRVPAYRCGTDWSGWLDGAHPTVEYGEFSRTVCFSDRATGCKYSSTISVKNCESFTSTKFLSPLVVFPATAAQTKSESNNFTK